MGLYLKVIEVLKALSIKPSNIIQLDNEANELRYEMYLNLKNVLGKAFEETKYRDSIV